MKDPYVYEGTDALVNKLGILDGEQLNQAETEFALLSIDSLRNSDFVLESIYDALKIHAALFADIYEWAGELRTIDVYKSEPILNGKSIDYVFASYLQQALHDLQKEFEVVVWEELDSKEKIEKVCYFVSEFWHIHPFREGNTRTTALFLYFLIKKVGLHVNLDFLSKNGKYFRDALVLSCLYSASRSEFLLGIVADSVSSKNFSNGKYQTIDGTEIEKYSYSHHTIDRLETIKKPQDWRK